MLPLLAVESCGLSVLFGPLAWEIAWWLVVKLQWTELHHDLWQQLHMFAFLPEPWIYHYQPDEVL